jgi:hypothetical protein
MERPPHSSLAVDLDDVHEPAAGWTRDPLGAHGAAVALSQSSPAHFFTRCSLTRSLWKSETFFMGGGGIGGGGGKS